MLHRHQPDSIKAPDLPPLRRRSERLDNIRSLIGIKLDSRSGRTMVLCSCRAQENEARVTRRAAQAPESAQAACGADASQRLCVWFGMCSGASGGGGVQRASGGPCGEIGATACSNTRLLPPRTVRSKRVLLRGLGLFFRARGSAGTLAYRHQPDTGALLSGQML